MFSKLTPIVTEEGSLNGKRVQPSFNRRIKVDLITYTERVGKSRLYPTIALPSQRSASPQAG